jgi:hypothetical protein
LLLVCAIALPASASLIDIGLISYDVVIPAGIAPGVNAIDLFNYTGQAFGPFAGSPYVITSVHFTDAELVVSLVGGGSVIEFQNVDTGPGEYLFPSDFPSTTEIASAEFTATLNVTSLNLSDGDTFDALADISVDLLPSSGGALQPGVDFAPIYAQSAGTATPEPGTVVLMSLGILGLVGRRRR